MIHPILATANDLIGGDRRDAYGKGPNTFPGIAQMWSSLFDTEITPEMVALAMILVKVERLKNDPTRADSWADIAGYAALGADAVWVRTLEDDPQI